MEAQRRLDSELEDIVENPPPGISAGLVNDNNLFVWSAIICGPDDTPYEGGAFEVEVNFPSNYPNSPPKVRFLCEMFHPNIYSSGNVCLDVIGDRWKPTFTASSVLYAIQNMLGDPNPESPANSEAKRLFCEDKVEFARRVKNTIKRK